MTPNKIDAALLNDMKSLTTAERTFIEARAAQIMPSLVYKSRDGYEKAREIATILVLRYYAGLIP